MIERGLIERPIDGNHGEIHPKSEDFVAEGVPFVMASDMRNGGVEYTNCSRISVRQAEGLRKGFARNGDVLLSHKATIGQTAIVQYDEHPYVMLTPQVTYYRVRDPSRLSNRYLKFYFDSSLFQQTLHLWAGSGSTRAYLGITEQQRLPVILPPVPKQRKIAAILSAYDDLIANNQRRIALLESMAEEIYREWFVRMRFPEHKSARSSRGLPVGWRTVALDTLVKEVKSSIKKVDLSSVAKYVGLEHIPRQSVALSAWGAPDEVDSDKLRFESGDILFGKIRPYLRKVALAPFSGACSTDTIVLRARRDEWRLFVLFTVASATFADLATTASKGTKMPRADWHFLKRQVIRFPSDSLVLKFDELSKPLLKEIHLLLECSDRLATQRSVLLPRLISGKLRVDHLDIRMPPSMQVDEAAAT